MYVKFMATLRNVVGQTMGLTSHFLMYIKFKKRHWIGNFENASTCSVVNFNTKFEYSFRILFLMAKTHEGLTFQYQQNQCTYYYLKLKNI